MRCVTLAYHCALRKRIKCSPKLTLKKSEVWHIISNRNLKVQPFNSEKGFNPHKNLQVPDLVTTNLRIVLVW